MFKIALKIWLVANLIVFGVFSAVLFPEGIPSAFLALLFSSLFSLPAIALLYYLLRFLRYLHGTVVFSWLVLLLGTGGIAFLAVYLFSRWFGDSSGELGFLNPLGFISGYAAVLIFSPALHYLFQKFRYEND